MWFIQEQTTFVYHNDNRPMIIISLQLMPSAYFQKYSIEEGKPFKSFLGSERTRSYILFERNYKRKRTLPVNICQFVLTM